MQAQATAVHGFAAQKHSERRDTLLAQARNLDFRTLDRDQYDALVRQAEIEHGYALACAGEQVSR